MGRMLWVRGCPSAPFYCVQLECTNAFLCPCPSLSLSHRSTASRSTFGRGVVWQGGVTRILWTWSSREGRHWCSMCCGYRQRRYVLCSDVQSHVKYLYTAFRNNHDSGLALDMTLTHFCWQPGLVLLSRHCGWHDWRKLLKRDTPSRHKET